MEKLWAVITVFLMKRLTLPDWIPQFLTERPAVIPSLEARVRLAIELSRENTIRGTGGPFGAAIFERDSGRLVAVGVNRVVPDGCSLAHAETVAIAMAQEKLGSFDLGNPSFPAHELVTSTQMCVMCYGAVFWSGVRRVVCAASTSDVHELTSFDEGPVPSDWRQQLESRGIEVQEGILRDKARAVLAAYQAANGPIYNSQWERSS